MSRRRGAAAPAATATEQVEEEEEHAPGLKFNESLSWRPASKPATGELLRRLKSLAQELKDMDQEDADREALSRPAKELAHANLLQHKDKGVRAWSACCLADIFRLCAPEAPFTAQQLKDIFSLIITSIFPALSDSSDPYNTQHTYVLLSLAQVKSVVLLTDVPSPNQLILKLFETCFDILSNPGEEMSKNIEYHMTSILECMIDESQGLPSEVIEIVLAQFMRADPKFALGSSAKVKKAMQTNETDETQSQNQLGQYSAAYNMAKNVSNTCVDRMSRYVSQYFTNVIMTATSSDRPRKSKSRHSKRANSPDEDSDVEMDAGPDEEGLKQLDKAHRLLRELWKACPGVLQNVIPQIEQELSVENVAVRTIATEAIGDLASGIGAAGPPPPAVLDPASYPALTLGAAAREISSLSGPNLPSAPQSFSQAHPVTYQSFLSRQKDKSPLVRACWVKSIGSILSTSAGGIGLEVHDETQLVDALAEKLLDTDEKVRIAAIESIGQMRFLDIVNKICLPGGITASGSPLYNLALLVKDRKHGVRAEAMLLLGKLWGVASGELLTGNDSLRELFGSIPSAIFSAAYVNELDVNLLIEKVLYESFIPMGWPAMKKKSKAAVDSQGGSQSNGDIVNVEAQADKLRTERMLTLLRDLDQKAKTVFFAFLAQQNTLGEHVKALLKRCEDYNGGSPEGDEKEIKTHLGKLISFFAKAFPDSQRVTEDLWRFAKQHDRRCYALMRFCISDDSDYTKVHKSMKEMLRRTDSLSTTTGTLPQTLTALCYRVGNILYNRSHIQPIMAFTQSFEDGLAAPAQELVKSISAHRPGVFKAHIQDLCLVLQEQAPRAGRENEPDAVDGLKACASFAKRFPKQVSKDPKFVQALMQYAVRGTPASTAKYATSVLMTISDKKEMHARDLLKQCVKGFTYGSEHFMARLATLSQLMLSAAGSLHEEKDVDPVIDIAIKQILSVNRTSPTDEDEEWTDQPDEECEAKTWALKILVNRLRSYDSAAEAMDAAKNVYLLLNKLVILEGELSQNSSIPKAHRSWLHLQASLQLLKLSSTHDFDQFLLPKSFNVLATVSQTPVPKVRQGFVTKVQKYLGQGMLPSRFYLPIFLLAFEPVKKFKQDSVTWLKARAQVLAKAKKTTFEVMITRLLSLLAHHPDFDNTTEDLKGSAQYIIFYLKAVATEDNTSLIYHMAQRIKNVKDAINPESSENLYILSEMAQTMIGHFADFHNWTTQAYSGPKMGLPSGIFTQVTDSHEAHEIATKQYLQQDLVDDLEALVKESLRTSKKRRSDGDNDQPNKKRATASAVNGSAKPKAASTQRAKRPAKTPKKKRATSVAEETPNTERRKSGRAAGRKSYAETSDNEDDAEMEEWDEIQEEEDVDEDDEVQIISTRTNGVRNGTRAKAKATTEDESDEQLSEPPESDEE